VPDSSSLLHATIVIAKNKVKRARYHHDTMCARLLRHQVVWRAKRGPLPALRGLAEESPPPLDGDVAAWCSAGPIRTSTPARAPKAPLGRRRGTARRTFERFQARRADLRIIPFLIENPAAARPIGRPGTARMRPIGRVFGKEPVLQCPRLRKKHGHFGFSG
jgi:hypothetical protein